MERKIEVVAISKDGIASPIPLCGDRSPIPAGARAGEDTGRVLWGQYGESFRSE